MIVKRGAETIEIQDLDRLQRIEVWNANYGQKSNRKVGNLAPMLPEHFAERRASGAFQANATGRPRYYTHTDTGIEIHPACDRDYWFEPVFNNPKP